MKFFMSTRAPCALLSLFLTVVSATTTSPCCAILESLYPGKTYSGVETTYVYQKSLFYWAQQSYASPGCVFTAETVQDVSNAVKIFHENRCEYALRSGGHNPIPGFTNTNGGVLLATNNINDVTYDVSTQTVKIGAGCVWGDVYSVLDPLGVATPGGRDNRVGTGGFLLGGGISLFANSRGWAADGIVAFDVVYANGTIGRITQSSYPELFTGMKGAGSLFAIVTHFTQKTFALGTHNAGFRFYPELSIPKTLSAVYNYSTVGALADPKSHIIIAFTQPGPGLVNLAALCFFYPEPLGTGEAEVFKPFKEIPFILSTKRDRTGINSVTGEVASAQTDGRRQSFTDMAIVLQDPNILSEFYTIFNTATIIPKATITGFLSSLIFYPLTSKFVAEGHSNGKKNSMGLEDTPAGQAGKTIMIVSINLSWQLQVHDTAARNYLDDVFGKWKAHAQAKGVYHPFQYLNYADGTQNVLAGYGSASVARLKKLKQEVDPTNDFGTLVKGRYPIPS